MVWKIHSPGLASKEVWGLILNDDLLNNEFQNVNAYILIGSSLVGGRFYLPNVEKQIVIISKVGGRSNQNCWPQYITEFLCST